jgi:hypothetical protein
VEVSKQSVNQGRQTKEEEKGVLVVYGTKRYGWLTDALEAVLVIGHLLLVDHHLDFLGGVHRLHTTRTGQEGSAVSGWLCVMDLDRSLFLISSTGFYRI